MDITSGLHRAFIQRTGISAANFALLEKERPEAVQAAMQQIKQELISELVTSITNSMRKRHELMMSIVGNMK